MSEHVDLIIEPDWIIPVEPAGRVLDHHALAVHEGRVAALITRDEAREYYRADEHLRLPGHALTPGFVNAHTHSPMSLMRGFADDLPLMTWLNEHIWPVEGKLAGPDFIRDGAELSMAEMLRGGTTCFNDMYFFPDVVARSASRMRIRAVLGMIVIEFPTPWASEPAEYLRRGLEVRDEFKSDPLLNFVFAPHAPYTVSDDSFQRLRGYADELDTRVHMHLHETAHEVEEAEREHGERPMDRMERLGLLNPSMLAVHMTQLSEDEIRRAGDHGISVVHCPESNLKLASGFCPVAELQAAGVNVALGTDGAASNNDSDMVGEMRSAALLGKAVAGDPAALPAEDVLSMATINGARALGLDAEIGSLLPGKWADLTAIRLDHLASTPVHNPISQIVYAAGRDQVNHVWVGGRRTVADGRLVEIDEHELRERVNAWVEPIHKARAEAREAAGNE